MNAETWPPLMARLRRQRREMRLARWVFRLLRFREIEPLGIGEYAVAFGYVTFSNDLIDVLAKARKAAFQTDAQAALDLMAAIERFDEMYPGLQR